MDQSINLLSILQTSRVITVLACSGRVLRLLEHCRVRKLIELESIPTVLYVPKNSIGNRILVGFSDGRVSLFHINPMLTEGLFVGSKAHFNFKRFFPPSLLLIVMRLVSCWRCNFMCLQ